MLEETERWLGRRSWAADDRSLPNLLAAKRAAGSAGSVSVVLPALDEEATVGTIVEVLRRELVESVPLVDELLVVDSGSTDRTAEVAAAAGAKVVHRDEILPRLPALPGKGEVLWRSLLATSGEIVCFVDADLRDFDARFVSGILGPLFTEPDVHLVKAMYDRPFGDDPTGGRQGGRVTELVARPLLNLHWPRLAGMVQPLGGEYAGRRSLLERLSFPVGYGVELGLLIDTLELAGLDALAQVDVGVRRHRHQDGQALGRMAAAVLNAAQRRLPVGAAAFGGEPTAPDRADGTTARAPSGLAQAPSGLTQFERAPDGGFVPRTHLIAAEERPPMITVPEYTVRVRPGDVTGHTFGSLPGRQSSAHGR